MSEYVIRPAEGHGMVTYSEECLPFNEDVMNSLYSAKFALYIDGKKQSKADALKFIKDIKKKKVD